MQESEDIKKLKNFVCENINKGKNNNNIWILISNY